MPVRKVNMALEKQMKKEKSSPKNEDEMDLEIGVLLGKRMLEDGGFDIVEKAVATSRDPSQVIGQFLMQMGQEMMENMPEDVKLTPAILLSPGGWLEQISDFIQTELDVKKDVMDKAEVYVASTASQMAQAKQGQTNGVQAPAVPVAGAPLEGAV
jgi:hypothetical protein